MKIKSERNPVFPDEQANFGLVNCLNNGLIQTIQECYDNHRPLVLTPDIIWLAICQGISIHINGIMMLLKTSCSLRISLIKSQLEMIGLEYSAKHWKNLIASFANETKKYTHDDFIPF